MTNSVGAPIHGYSRADVEHFLAAAAEERSRLEAEISELEGRILRARSAIGMHQVMVAMLLETEQEVLQIREDASRRAEQIVREAELKVGGVAWTADAAPSSSRRANGEVAIDLVEPTLAPVAAPTFRLGGSSSDTADEDEYMRFLRGALADESPLGPNGD